jgi:hypothetical protein
MTHIETDDYELKTCFLYVTQPDRSSMCLHLYWFCMLGKGKDKGHPITGHQAPRGEIEVWLCSFSTSALGGSSCQHHASADLPPGKTQNPLYRRLGGPHGRSGRVRKLSPPPGFFFRSSDRPARSQLLYWLSYPAHLNSRQQRKISTESNARFTLSILSMRACLYIFQTLSDGNSKNML